MIELVENKQVKFLFNEKDKIDNYLLGMNK